MKLLLEVRRMTNISFAEQAKQRSLDFFQAYGVENNMEKVLSFFSKESALIGWGPKEIYFDYAAIVATAHQRMTIPFFMQFDDISTEIINATANFCIVMVTAKLTYHTDRGNTVREQERATFVYRKEQGEPKIVYLHSSAAKKIQAWGIIQPLEHGVEATRRLRQLECDRSMAIDMCEHTPNGLLYCSIGEHFPFIYANQALCDILGFKDFTELMEYTKGMIESCIYQADIERIQHILVSFTNGIPYTINYRLLTKQGQVKWIMERGRYVLDADTGEEYYICTIIPLELEQDDFSYGNLVDYSYIENAPLSIELFLEQTLDYMSFKERPAVCQKLLQHCCETLQASGAVLYSLKEQDKRFKIIHYFDKANLPMRNIYSHLSWDSVATYFEEAGFSLCSDINNFPNSAFHCLGKEGLRSCISKVITIQGEDAYLLSIYHRGKAHAWTENERDIVEQAAKLYELLLDEDF